MSVIFPERRSASAICDRVSRSIGRNLLAFALRGLMTMKKQESNIAILGWPLSIIRLSSTAITTDQLMVRTVTKVFSYDRLDSLKSSGRSA